MLAGSQSGGRLALRACRPYANLATSTRIYPNVNAHCSTKDSSRQPSRARFDRPIEVGWILPVCGADASRSSTLKVESRPHVSLIPIVFFASQEMSRRGEIDKHLGWVAAQHNAAQGHGSHTGPERGEELASRRRPHAGGRRRGGVRRRKLGGRHRRGSASVVAGRHPPQPDPQGQGQCVGLWFRGGDGRHHRDARRRRQHRPPR